MTDLKQGGDLTFSSLLKRKVQLFQRPTYAFSSYMHQKYARTMQED
jgi:hypothetical protein